MKNYLYTYIFHLLLRCTIDDTSYQPASELPSMRLWNQFSRDRCEWTCYGCYVLSGWDRCGESWTWYVEFFFSFFLSLSIFLRSCLLVYLLLFFFNSKRPGIIPKLEALRTLYEGKKNIVGRDKLDVVKGVLQKVRCFSLFSLLRPLKETHRVVIHSYEHSKFYFTIIQNGSETSLWSKWLVLLLLILPNWRGWWVRLWRI